MSKATSSNKITHAVVRMYCMGTGDCFVVKFFAGTKEKFKLMIDCGVWSGSAKHLGPFIKNLKEYVNNEVDLLVITHEHTDHVSVFEACADMFTKNFEVKKIWMGWSENDSLSKIKKWKTEYGEKRKALAMASDKLEKSINDPEWKSSVLSERHGQHIFGAKEDFSQSLKDFSALHAFSANGVYKGALEGMKIVKKQIAKNDNIEYLYPGDIVEDLKNLEGVKFYVLGPPEKWAEVETEGGGEGESYTHNTILKGTNAFALSVLPRNTANEDENVDPFESFYEVNSETVKKGKSKAKIQKKLSEKYKPNPNPEENIVESYATKDNRWRNIDNDWLFSAGNLALRISSLTNNLSLALAIEFEDSKRVMLFPGDAEYGSWSSWHKINWKGVTVADGKHFTQDLLRRTVFYKVAHHMSHNGTAQKLGLEMMEHKDLAAMATLDYDVISKNWKNTMPNREMLTELLKRTKGRLMIMNESHLFFDFKGKEKLVDKIKDARKKMTGKEEDAFKKSYTREKNNLYVEFTVSAD